MTTLAAKLASIGLAAALPLAAVATPAHARPIKIDVSDIDYATEEGRRTFEARAERAARDFCIRAPAAGAPVAISRSCAEAVKQELMQKMHRIHQARIAPGPTLAGR